MPELLPVPPSQGGAVEHWVHELSKRLSGDRLSISIISRPSDSPGLPGVRYLSIPWSQAELACQRIKTHTSRLNPLRHLAKIQNVWSYGRRVASLLSGFNVIYLHNEPNLLLFIRKKPGQKLVLHMHNDHLSLTALRPLYRHLLHKADTILCVSEYIRNQAIRNFPEHASRIHTILNATDPAVFKPYGDDARRQLADLLAFDPGRQYMLYVGRLTPVKGVHVLIEAFRLVHQKMPETTLIIAGSAFFGGAARTAYERKLAELAAEASQAIVFTGFIAHEKLKYLYSAADLLIVPSIWQDPCPLVVLEGMASGTCVIASSVGGVPEILDTGHNGFLVEPNDPASLAATMLDVLEHPDKLNAIGSAAREHVLARFSWDRLIADVRQFLEPAI